jgi:hypothetical protein
VNVRDDLIPNVLVEHPLAPAAMERVRLFVEKRFVIVRTDAEDLHAPGIDEVANRRDQAVAVKFPFIAVTGGKREQRWSPMAEDRDAHVVPQPRRMPVLVEGVHNRSVFGSRLSVISFGYWLSVIGYWFSVIG